MVEKMKVIFLRRIMNLHQEKLAAKRATGSFGKASRIKASNAAEKGQWNSLEKAL